MCWAVVSFLRGDSVGRPFTYSPLRTSALTACCVRTWCPALFVARRPRSGEAATARASSSKLTRGQGNVLLENPSRTHGRTHVLKCVGVLSHLAGARSAFVSTPANRQAERTPEHATEVAQEGQLTPKLECLIYVGQTPANPAGHSANVRVRWLHLTT